MKSSLRFDFTHWAAADGPLGSNFFRLLNELRHIRETNAELGM